MKVTMLEPQSYCKGVQLALDKLEEAVKENNEIYLLGPIIHNDIINNYYKAKGVKILDLKEKTKEEHVKVLHNKTIVFQAHGTSKNAFIIAKNNNNKIIDATCPYVALIHKKVEEKINNGYDVIYIGKHNHEESVATCSISNRVHLIENIYDLDTLKIDNNKIYATNQTTLSILDIKKIYDKIAEIFPNAIIDNKICLATYKRQEAILNSEKADLIIIVGDKSSSNSKRLYELSKSKGNALFINSVKDILDYDFSSVNSVLISSGASTPLEVVLEVKAFLENLPK